MRFILFTKVTSVKMAFVYITWMHLPLLCHAYVSFSFICPLTFYHQHNRYPQQKAQKNHLPSIPLRRVFTICRIIASRCTWFFCLLVRLFCSFGWLLRCLSAPCRCVPSCRHATLFTASCLSSSLLSCHRHISSCLVVASHPLANHVMPGIL